MEVCRLCLDIQSDNTFSPLDGTYKDMVQVVAPELRLEISNEPVVCHECSTNLDELFRFKTKCFENEAEIRPKCEGKKNTLRLKEVLDGTTNADGIALKTEKAKDKTCRTCLGPIECESFTILKPSEPDAYLDSILTLCLPEIDLELTKDPVICESCMDNLQKLHHFKSTCLDIEDKLTSYCEVHGTNSSNQINLNSVLESEVFKMDEDDSGFANIKSEPFKTESEDASMQSTNDSEMTGDASLKQEELDIKSEAGTSTGGSDRFAGFRCSECSFASFYRRSITRHLKLVHRKGRNTPNQYKCSKCSFETMYNSVIQNHTKFIHENIKEHACSQCSFATSYKQCLADHIKSVHEKLKNVACPQCSYVSSSKNNVRRHVAAVHKKNKITRIACSRCPCVFSNKSNMTKHMQSVHDKTETFTCSQCSYICFSKNNLTKHTRAVHDKIRNHACFDCSYMSFSKSNLVKHIKSTHDKIKDHACSQCSFVTSYKHCLESHVKSMHDKNFACSQCLYTSPSRRNLTHHIKAFHTVR